MAKKIKVEKSVEISAGAKVTPKIMTLREYVNYYNNLKASGYEPPKYQRETVLRNAGSMMVTLASYAMQFEKGYAPLTEFIYIREIPNDDGTVSIEIIDGQHRSEMFSLIISDQVKAARNDCNRELNKICQVLEGRSFEDLDEVDADLMDNIFDLKVPVQFVTCSDEIASVLFQILNLGTPLKTNDKIRNNWYKNNMYCAIENICKETNLADWGMRKDAFRNMLYRCVSMHKKVNVRASNVKDLNNKVLNKTDNAAKWTKTECEKMIADIMKVLTAANQIMKGRNVHEKMAMYIFLSEQRNKSAIIKSLNKPTKLDNFIRFFVYEKDVEEKTTKLRDDTPHNIGYTKAYCPVIKRAWEKAQEVK